MNGMQTRQARGPLGALPKLSRTTRLALIGYAMLAVGNAAALIAQAWALASLLADVVLHSAAHMDITSRLLILTAAVLARAFLGWATETVSMRSAAGTKEELRARLVDHTLRLGPEWIVEHGPAELTVLATKGLDTLDNYFTKYLPALVSATILPPLTGVWILLHDWPSALLIAITVPLIPVFAILIGKFTEHRTARAADASARLSGYLLELIRALPVLTAFQRAAAQSKAVRGVSDQYRTLTMATLRVAFLSALALETIATLAVALVAVDIGLRLVSGQLTLETGLMVLLLVPECYLPLRAAGAAFHASEDGVETVRRINAIIATPISKTSSGSKEIVPTSGQLKVDNLRVARRNGYAPDGISFTLEPGKIVRLNTPSGSGKSTVLSVLLGFVQPTEGRITVGQTPLSELQLSAWRRQIAWVPQHPAFTADTVAEELVFTLSGDQPLTRQELETTAKTVAAEHLLDRKITELSTGERQRVAIARALLRVQRGARWLLLDEPTAHLDQATAGLCMATINKVAALGVGVLLITHRAVHADTSGAEPSIAQLTVDNAPANKPFHLWKLCNPRLLFGMLLAVAATGFGIALTATASWLIAKAAGQPPILTLSIAIVAVRVFGLGKGALRYLERLVTHDAAFRLAGELRVRLWQALVRLGPAKSLRLRHTDGVQRLVDDTDTVRDLVSRVLAPPLVALVVAGVAVTIETIVLPSAGAVLAAALVIAGVLGPMAAILAERRASTALAEGRRELAIRVLGLFDAAADLLAFGTDRKQRDAIAKADADLVAKVRKQAFGNGIANAVIIGVLGLATVACVVLAASAAAAGTLDPVYAPLLALVCVASIDVVTPLPAALQRWGTLKAAYQRIALLGNEETFNSKQPASTDGRIRLDNVDVGWPNTLVPALRDVCLDIPAGTHVAIVGPSGAGKTTLLALLLGFLTPDRGIFEIPQRVSWCPQEPQLVSTTIRENLRLGSPHASDDQLREVLRKAELPQWTDQLDTIVGAAGALVSGGEAQRLAMARALLAAEHADLVLLDEPTAHLDELTSRRLLATIQRELADKTVIHVTHRPEEAAHADLVVDVSSGTIAVREPKAA